MQESGREWGWGGGDIPADPMVRKLMFSELFTKPGNLMKDNGLVSKATKNHA